MYLAVLLVEVAFTWVDGVVHGCITENQLEVGAGGSERDLCVALPTAVLKSYLPFLDGSVSVTRVSHLALAAQSPKKLVGVELGLLIGNHAGHLEHQAGWPRLFVQSHSIEGQHTNTVIAHGMHHLDC